MVLQIKKTKGLTCKACNRSLDFNDCDGELCGNCLNVVHEINQNVYNENDVLEPESD